MINMGKDDAKQAIIDGEGYNFDKILSEFKAYNLNLMGLKPQPRGEKSIDDSESENSEFIK
jgi:hypothetical protein